MRYCSVNGKQVTQLAVNDRGFSYGDGIFTTAKIAAGNIEMLGAHLNRLVTGCQQLGLPAFDSQALQQELMQLALPYALAVVKVVVTSGQGGRGYSRIGCHSPTIVISIFDYPEHYQQWQTQGICLGLSGQQLGLNPMLLGLKHLNRLEQVLLRQELDQRDEDDLLVLNIQQQVVETSCANVFWCSGEQLYTPIISASGVAGLMRARLLDKFPHTIVQHHLLADLDCVTSMFVCNSVMGVVPVNCFMGKSLDIKAVTRFQEVFV